MNRDKKKLSVTSQILLALLEAGGQIQKVRMLGQLSMALYPEYRKYVADRKLETTIQRLKKQGWLKFEYSEAKKILALTNKGQLEALFEKSKLGADLQRWDGKWRLAIFDIPEHARGVRARLRSLLKGYGFVALQASVYVQPFALSSVSIAYLKASGLTRYIRFARVDAFDTDSDLRKRFRVRIAKNDGRHI